MYLPEGGYPAPLNVGDALHDFNCVKECMNRCMNAYGKDEASTSGGKIGNKAFYVKSNGGCACAVGDCRWRGSGGYVSYAIISGNR